MSSTRAATVLDVARAAGVSAATVSRVLNGKRNVDPALTMRVQQAVRQVGYATGPAGRPARRERPGTWALIVPDVMNTFFTSIMEAFESAAMTMGHTVVLCNTKESLQRERAYVDQMVAQPVSGVVLAATSVTRSSVRRLTEAGVPVVLLDRRLRHFEGDIVTVDNDLVGELAAEHLLDRGVRRPVIVSSPSTISSAADRERGFRSAYARAGLALGEENLFRMDLMADQPPASLAATLARLGQIDGLFAVNGRLTAACYRAVQEVGWAMPGRVRLVGVDDDHWTTMVTPRVSIVAQPVGEMGRWAARLLHTRAQGSDLAPAKIILDPMLHARESSA